MPRVRYLLCLNFTAAFAVGVVTFLILYHTGLSQTGEMLRSMVEDRKQVIIAVSRFDQIYSDDFPGGWREATLSQLEGASGKYEYFGKTGEFTVAERDSEWISFLFRQRHADFDYPEAVPFDSELAEPMRRALLGEAGVIQSLDHEGNEVLAAYTPLPVLGLGLVAKIDIAEIKQPYLIAAGIMILTTLLILGLSSIAFYYLIRPIQKRIKEDGNQLRRLIEGRTDFVLRTTHTGALTYVNEAYCRFRGVGHSELIGKTVREIFQPESLVGLSKDIKGLSDGNRSFVREINEVSSFGATLCIEWTVSQLVTYRDEPAQYLAIGRDITQQKSEENARKELQRIIEHSPVILFLWKNEAGWPVEFVSKNISSFGYSDEDFLSGKIRFVEIIHPDDLQRVADEVAANSEGKRESFAQQYRVRSGFGDYRYIEDRTWIRRNSEGEITHYQGLVSDVSERKKLEFSAERINQSRRAVLRAQNILIKAVDESTMWRDVVDSLIDERKYSLAWVGTPDNDENGSVTPGFSAGRTKNFLDDVTIHWHDDAFGQGPTGVAVREKSIQVANSDSTSGKVLSLSDKEKAYGFKAAASVPILLNDRVEFTLNVYSEAEASFDAAEIELLRELAAELSIVIQGLRATEESESAKHALGKAALGAINSIAATIEHRDPYTAGHQSRVSELAVSIARELGWNEFRVEGLRLGAIIHDIGKIHIPAEILNRPGKLSDAEFQIIKSHPVVGAEIVSHSDFPWPIREMIIQHHERIDGTGYPYGLRGDEIIDEAKVLAVADVVEAITAHRPYRPALGVEAGLAEIERGKGTAYDPTVVDICTALIAENRFTWSAKPEKPFSGALVKLAKRKMALC